MNLGLDKPVHRLRLVVGFTSVVLAGLVLAN